MLDIVNFENKLKAIFSDVKFYTLNLFTLGARLIKYLWGYGFNSYNL